MAGGCCMGWGRREWWQGLGHAAVGMEGHKDTIWSGGYRDAAMGVPPACVPMGLCNSPG